MGSILTKYLKYSVVFKALAFTLKGQNYLFGKISDYPFVAAGVLFYESLLDFFFQIQEICRRNTNEDDIYK